MTPPPDSIGVRLCLGLIGVLQQLDLAEYDPATAPPADSSDVWAFLLTVPTSPDRIVSLTPYTVSSDPGEAMSTVAVQVRTRWAGSNPRGVMNYSEAVFDALHGLGPMSLPGGVSMSQCLRRTSVSLGQESSGSRRWSWADNYYCDVHHPTTNRP